MRRMKNNAAIFSAYMAECGLPRPVVEYRFHSRRKWRFDFAWPLPRVALEVEGGVWIGGRHNRAAGFLGDIEKYNAAALLGWRILRVTPSDLCTLRTAQLVKQALAQT